jgi:hypothetical protein
MEAVIEKCNTHITSRETLLRIALKQEQNPGTG